MAFAHEPLYDRDALLVLECRQGDGEAFNQLMRIHLPWVYGLCRRISGDEAEDFCQEIFLKVYQNLHSLKNPRAFSAWLRKLTWHHCRRRKNETIQAVGASFRGRVCDMLSEIDGPILEVAAGPGGGNLAPVLHRNPEAYLIANDISVRVLQLWNRFLRGQGEFPNVCFAAFDARRMPLRDASVSAVSSSGGFSNISNAEKAISEAYRTLKPGGKLYAQELLVDPLDWAQLPDDYRQNRESSILKPFAELLRNTGFNILEHNVSPNIRALEPEESGLAKETAPYGVTLHVRLEDIIAEKP